MPISPGWSGDGGAHPRYRIDGYAKATGAKLYARDFRAADMPGWPSKTSHALLLMASDATHRFVDINLDGLGDALQPYRIVMAHDMEAAGIKALEPYEGGLFCPKGQTPIYLGQPVAMLIYNDLAKFTLARQRLRGDRSVLVFGEETGPTTEKPFGANRITRVSGAKPGDPDVFSPVRDGWIEPVKFSRDQRPIWAGTSASDKAAAQAAQYGKQIRDDLTSGKSGRLFRQKFRTQSVDPMFMEPESGLAWHDAKHGRLSLVLGVQSPAEQLKSIADMLENATSPYAVSEIEGHFAYLGGAFGGKDITIVALYVAIAGLFNDGHPVRLALDRFDQFQLGVKRHSVTIDSAIGVNPETGRFEGFFCDLELNGGGLANSSVSVADVSAVSSASAYYMPKSDVTTTAIHSRAVTAGSMRGYGGLQSITAMECLVDRAASDMNIDPIELRLKNVMRTGDLNLTGAAPSSYLRGDEVLKRMQASNLWSDREEERKRFESANPSKAYGVGVACSLFKYGTGEDATLAAVSLDKDGRISVTTSSVEMGTGTSTAVAVRVADYLGRSADSVLLDYTGPIWRPLGLVEAEKPWGLSQEELDRFSKNPRWTPVIATRASASVGAPFTTYAVSQAAELLLRHSLWKAAQDIWSAGPLGGEAAGFSIAFENLRWYDGALTAKGLEPIPLERLAHRVHEKGMVTGVMVHAFNRWSWARADFEIEGDTWTGDIDALAIERGGKWRTQDRKTVHYPDAGFKRISATYASTCGVVVALSVDRTNGAVEILNVHEVLDCGRVLIPEQVSAIAQGGVAMGIGHALSEYLPLYEDGPGNGSWNLNRYNVVRARDLPMRNIVLETLPPLGDSDIPKGIAEIVMTPVAPGVLNAIHDAVKLRFDTIPVTADDITGAL